MYYFERNYFCGSSTKHLDLWVFSPTEPRTSSICCLNEMFIFSKKKSSSQTHTWVYHLEPNNGTTFSHPIFFPQFSIHSVFTPNKLNLKVIFDVHCRWGKCSNTFKSMVVSWCNHPENIFILVELLIWISNYLKKFNMISHLSNVSIFICQISLSNQCHL